MSFKKKTVDHFGCEKKKNCSFKNDPLKCFKAFRDASLENIFQGAIDSFPIQTHVI